LDYVCNSQPQISVRFFKESNYILVTVGPYPGDKAAGVWSRSLKSI